MTYYYFFLIFIFSTLSFKLFIYIAKNKNFTDKPENISSHTITTPTSGGLVMFLIFLPAVLYFVYFLNFNNEYLPNKLYLFFICLTVFSIFSFYDDVKDIHPIYRLIIQFFLILLSSPLFNLNEFPFENMIKLNLILYLYFYIYFLNIINFTDGTDGFLSVNSISFFIGIIILSIFENNFHFIELISFIILPILFSFLIFNKPQAKLFMGDTGSIFLGYLIGFCSIELISNGKWYIVISLISYTFLDCTTTLIKKSLNGHYPWARLFDYYFLKPIKQSKNNHRIVLKYNLIFNILNLMVIFFQVSYDLKYLFIISMILSIMLMYKYSQFDKIKF